MKNVLGSGVEVRRVHAWDWAGQLLPAYVAHVAGVLAVVLAIRSRSLGWLVLGGAYLAIATIVLEARLARQRVRQGEVAVFVRIGVGVVQLVVGVVLVRWVPGEAWTFVGVVSLLLFVSTVRAEYRRSDLGMHLRGPLLLAVAAVLAVLGLWPIGAIDPIAGVALVGFGALTAVVAVEVATEDWIRSGSTWSSAATRRAGAILLLAGTGAFVLTGGEPAYVILALVLFAVVFLGVLVASADSDSAEISVLLVIALVWAAAPRDVPPNVAVEPRPDAAFFVALGDSYISGEGAKRYFAGTNDKRAGECRRAPTAYPVKLAEHGSPGVPDRVLFLACSGALAVDLYGERPGRTEPVSQLDQLAEALRDLELDAGDLEFVLLSIGGNDAGFGEIGQACVIPGNCAEIGARWLDRLDQVDEELDRAYAAVREAIDARVLVVPYPMPLADRGCWWSTLLQREVRFVAGFVRELNDVVASVAERHGFEVVETMEPTFEPERLRVCDRSTPFGLGVNFIALNPTSGDVGDVVNPRNWLHNSLHPNETGHAAMFRTVDAWLTAPQPGAMTGLDPVADPIAVPCDGDDPPEPCGQRTAEWQGRQVLALMRAAAIPAALMAIASWLFVAPVMRTRAENRARSLGSRILDLVEWVTARLRGRRSA